ncbi:MAG: formimidoylglutamase [Deltaproteobacteria bacterium]|nr:formimidoylglutamase [Deltaproteobacteria bacterium]
MGTVQLIPMDPASFVQVRRADDPRLGERVQRLANLRDATKGTVVLIGVPDDRGVVAGYGRAGAADGPRALREQFYRLPLGPMSAVGTRQIADAGDLPAVGSTAATHEQLCEVVAAVAKQGGIPCVIGGGHDATYGSIKGFLQSGKGAGVINIDAHLDLRPLGPAGVIGSGTAFRRLIEERLLRGHHIVEFGLQQHAVAPMHWAFAREHGVRLWTWDDLQAPGVETVFAGLLRDLAGAHRRVAVSFDLDAVTAAEAPGVSAPNPAGFSAHDVLRLFQLAGADPAVGHLEIMELNPRYDIDGRTARLAALCLWYFCAARVMS